MKTPVVGDMLPIGEGADKIELQIATVHLDGKGGVRMIKAFAPNLLDKVEQVKTPGKADRPGPRVVN